MLDNRSIPSSTVIPELAYSDVEEAARWLVETFGFTIRVLIGSHRAQLNVGDGAIVVTKASVPEISQNETFTPHAVLVRVEDVDSHYRKAAERGATVLAAPADYPYGERQYAVRDFAGHNWTFSQTIFDIEPEQWGGTSVDF